MSDLIAKMTASVLIIENAKCLILEEEDADTRKFNLPGGHVDQVLLLGLEGYRIDPRAMMLYDEGKRIDYR